MSKNRGDTLGLSEADDILILLNVTQRWMWSVNDKPCYITFYRLLEHAGKCVQEVGAGINSNMLLCGGSRDLEWVRGGESAPAKGDSVES